ncbi:MAG TPA: NUDIX hydrolase [Phycisphaerales bacterium]|nr:NUDIX hydrolase [Phycisphaerales bacterium]
MNAGGTGDGRSFRWTPIDRDRLRVEQADGPTSARPEADLAVEQAWAAIRQSNPRSFNGPILAFESFDPEGPTIRVRRDEYRRYAVQPGVPTGVVLLGVSAVLTTRDPAGRPLVLLGRRNASTRVYRGMWELGPSGGVAPPPGDRPADVAYLRGALLEEIREEIGGVVAEAVRLDAAPVGLLHDPAASSVDVVFRARLPGPPAIKPPTPASWEYDELRWLPADEPGALDRLGPVAPPTRTLWAAIFGA